MCVPLLPRVRQVPNPVGLIRIRELDDFLEVWQCVVLCLLRMLRECVCV